MSRGALLREASQASRRVRPLGALGGTLRGARSGGLGFGGQGLASGSLAERGSRWREITEVGRLGGTWSADERFRPRKGQVTVCQNFSPCVVDGVELPISVISRHREVLGGDSGEARGGRPGGSGAWGRRRGSGEARRRLGGRLRGKIGGEVWKDPEKDSGEIGREAWGEAPERDPGRPPECPEGPPLLSVAPTPAL